MGVVRHKQPPLRRFAMYWVDHVRQAFSSLGELWRYPLATMMTLAVLGVSLALPSCFHVLLKNAEKVESGWQDSSQITLYLRKDLPEENILALRKRILMYPEVDSVDYMSRDKSLAEFRELSGFGDALDYLDGNPLPPVLIVVPDPRWRSPGGASELLAKLNGESGVEQGKLDLQWLERLQGIIKLLRHTITGIAVLLLAAVLLIVGNTLRLNILNQRSEIEVLKLVGATDAFIHRPFLYTGIWFGVIGGMLAWWLTEVMVLWSEGVVSDLAGLYGSEFRLMGLGLVDGLNLILLGAFLGLIASWFSVHRHIRDIEPS
ncbi:permease-like cell division protein FtsX [Aeromonas schubertii]|uniref:Cell division protein FtsX n=1 Tax=Aeromonas schubertii TaxID=652 RepID=A0A0S2SEG7_9GAMM|nr:permease-like cell division protein FtsX [Aeromonas schubertii]ALP40107.1 cell division membrane protein [Aeromonas schubertii]MBZ6065994.1 permease-like cell division protein FtsX [Aeromonas schubertii]MBZ6072752.1 permease-like cell division protein FtsX [Aeromonas schubertii]QCG49809.1 cell division protein FtsX [Aeromonas schubertii]